MKILFIAFLLFASLICQTCSSAPEQISLARQNQSPTPTPLPDKPKDSNESYLAADEDIVDRSGEIQMVFTGYLDFKDGKIVSENNWSVGEDKADIELKTGMQFDVLTCAGFAAQAKLKKYHGEKNASNQGYEWEMEFISGNIPESVVNAITKCREKDKIRSELLPSILPKQNVKKSKYKTNWI